MTDEFLSQKQLGELYGVGPHVVGKWLRCLGLRTADGTPTTTANELGYAVRRSGRRYAWHRAKVVALLERR